jgi:hypothetical protein
MMSKPNGPEEESSDPPTSEPQDQAEQPPPAPPANPKNKRWKVIAIAAAVVLVIGAAAASAYVYFKPSDDKATPESDITGVIKAYYAGGQDGDLAKYKATVCAPLAEFGLKNMTDGQFRALAKRTVDVNGRYVVDRVEDITISGDRAKATEIGHSQGGRLEEIGQQRRAVGLNKIEGSWKVCNGPTDDAATAEKKAQVTKKADARKAVESYFKLRTDGDLDGLILATCGELRQYFKDEDPKTFPDEIRRSPETLKSVDDVMVTGEAAKVTATVNVGTEPSVTAIVLSNEAYQWRVCKIEVIS